MSSAEKLPRMSIDEYLKHELNAQTKSEYIDGVIRAMAGASNRHNIIATNALAILWTQLAGKPCQPFNSDTKVRIQREGSTWFYYPDVSVVCHENPQTDSYQQRPAMVVEVLSRSSRAIDLDEKLNNYLTIPSLEYCLLLEQTQPRAILMRRTPTGFLRETYEGLQARISLESIASTLVLSDIYARVDFSPDSIHEPEAEYAN